MTVWTERLVIDLVLAVTAAIAVYPFIAPLVSAAVSGSEIGTDTLLAMGDMTSWPDFYASGEWTGHLPWMALAAATAFPAIAAYDAYQSVRTERNVSGGIYGDARIVSAPAELERTNDFWDGRGTPERAGLVLGGTPKGYYFDSSVPHALVVGKTGAGKSQLMVIETAHLCMAAGWNLIITGKPELLELTGDKARELGYEVAAIDLTGHPSASPYNPLELVSGYLEDGREEEAVRTARQVAADLVPLDGEKNPYFPRAARSALAAVIIIVCSADIPRGQKTMASVCEVIVRGTSGEDPSDPSAPLKEYIRGLGPAHPAYAPASDFLSDGGATTAGKNVLSTLKQAVEVFHDGSMRRATAASAVSIQDLVSSKSAVYIHLLEDGDPYMVVFKCFINQWWRVAQEVAAGNGGRLPHETAIVGDEIGNVGRIDCLPAVATLGRAYGLHLYMFVQNVKQLNRYNDPGDGGAGREKILGSVGTKVALALAEPEDFRYFTQLAGKRTVRTMGTSAQRSPGRSSSGTSYSETAVPLVNEWEWQNRIPVRDGSIAIKGGENSMPGREGVFQFPLVHANRTPAGEFFGLGDQDAERAKRSAFYARAVAGATGQTPPTDPWCPDFEAQVDEDGDEETADGRDEWSFWDE